MPIFDRLRIARPSLSFVLLCGFMIMLLIGGGASRADAAGQAVVRLAAWTCLVILVLFGERRPALRTGMPLFLVLAMIGLAVVQLVPLPPALWSGLPGATAVPVPEIATGAPAPWRPWSVVPSATVNALSSLIVVVTMYCLMCTIDPSERARVPGLVLCAILVAMLVALLQVSGIVLNNPLINDSVGQVSGTFANRNHLAVFLAIGCAVAPCWAFLDGRHPAWRAPTALGLVLVLMLAILATGSRAGILVGVLAVGIGLGLVWRDMRRMLRRYPRWVFPAIVAACVLISLALVAMSILFDRAASIDRALATDIGTDMRSRGRPIVIEMIRSYFPFGSGLGSFEPLFRLNEPFGLLKPSYFNHAHNDFLEIILETGVFGLTLLVVALLWWGRASFDAVRAGRTEQAMLPKLGAAIVLLVLVASISDYPARTPMMMAILMIAAMWLDRPGRPRAWLYRRGGSIYSRSAHPKSGSLP